MNELIICKIIYGDWQLFVEFLKQDCLRMKKTVELFKVIIFIESKVLQSG